MHTESGQYDCSMTSGAPTVPCCAHFAVSVGSVAPLTGSLCVPRSVPRRKGHSMKIRIRYDNQVTTIDVPEEDFTVMVQADYDERKAAATDPASVKPRTPQEIVEERFNRPDYNNWHRHWRHTDDNARPARIDHKKGFLGVRDFDGEEMHRYTVEDFPDTALPRKQERRDSYAEQCAMLRRALKPDYAEMIIAIHLDGLSLIDYAARIGDKPNNVSHRLQRAEKKLREILRKRPF